LLRGRQLIERLRGGGGSEGGDEERWQRGPHVNITARPQPKVRLWHGAILAGGSRVQKHSEHDRCL
jgi:hypothetical protein